MASWTFRISNRTGKPLTLQRTEPASLGAPARIEDGADADLHFADFAGSGELDYMVRPGELFGVRWSDSLGVLGFGLGLGLSEDRPGGLHVFSVLPAGRYCHPVLVVSGTGATICLPDYRDLRNQIALAAEAEADRWQEAATAKEEVEREKRRLPLRSEYGNAWKKDAAKEGMKSAMRRHSEVQNWCGIFGVWCVQRARPAEVAWDLGPYGGGPVGALRCTDFTKIHTGDIGHVWDDMEAQRVAYQKWLDGGKQGNMPVVKNHHVVVTRGGARPVTTVEGNVGNSAAFSVVKRGSRALGRGEDKIDFFYCSVPHPRCVLLAKERRSPGDCPFPKPEQPCPLPDP